ncbi:MAG: HigA family addiction module antitoxin [Dehalococcoidia bacterium]
MHPGEILREEFLAPLGLSAGTVARAIHVPRTRIKRLFNEQVNLTLNTALRLARYFVTTPQFWLTIQNEYAIDRMSPGLRDELQRIQPFSS